MSDDTRPGHDFEPEREFIVHDVEALKVYFDPLRMRIVHEIALRARSIHEIAEALGVPFTRLYYHMNLLEKHGIIKLVAVRQGAGAIEEKYYRVAARFFHVDRTLMTPGTAIGDAGMEAVLTTVLDETRRSIYAGIDAGVIDMTRRVPHPNALLIVRGVVLLTPEQAQYFQTRIKELLLEITGDNQAARPNTIMYNIALAFNPTVIPDDAPTEITPDTLINPDDDTR